MKLKPLLFAGLANFFLIPISRFLFSISAMVFSVVNFEALFGPNYGQIKDNFSLALFIIAAILLAFVLLAVGAFYSFLHQKEAPVTPQIGSLGGAMSVILYPTIFLILIIPSLMVTYKSGVTQVINFIIGYWAVILIVFIGGGLLGAYGGLLGVWWLTKKGKDQPLKR